MNKKNTWLGFVTLMLTIPMIASCGNNGKQNREVGFEYEPISFDDTIGTRTNNEEHDYANIRVNRTEEALRDDFAFGVDASMTQTVLNGGGVFYNERGQEQELFQILRKAGVNFVRFRLWNEPANKYGDPYGGGNNNVTTDIRLAQLAKRANLNVMIDFHYSDFWADPDSQRAPRKWSTKMSDKPQEIYDFTVESLQKFKDAGIEVDAVQIGNETNNGLAGYKINWNNASESFDVMASMLSKGCEAARSVFPNIKTVIHLANGGNKAEFESYFTNLDARGVDYDIIGASYYPHLSGSLDELQDNLNNISEKTGKPVIVAETSWGFTTDYNEYTENSYNAKDEDVGGYMTSEQAQATCLRDICNVLSKVPNKKGLGIFYWEPAWLPVPGASWATAAGQSYKYYGNDQYDGNYADGLATWSNQGLFSYTGKALASLRTYSYLRTGFNETSETATRVRKSVVNLTINLASNETLPETVKVETNFDAIRDANVTWRDEDLEAIKTKGDHNGIVGVVSGLSENNKVICNVKSIQNFVRDPGFEEQSRDDDTLRDPWVVESVSPTNDKVVKLDRKKDVRNGKTDLNWYHSSADFSFRVTQTITNLPAGNYTLTTYILAPEIGKLKHTSLKIFLQISGGETHELDICSSEYLKGWSAGYQTCTIANVAIAEGATIKIGIEGAAERAAWAHNDDWELVNDVL